MSVEVRRVSKDYGGARFRALHDVSLSVGTGELVALLGPSGSGKTTLLRIVAGLEQADEGSGGVFFHGEEVTHQPLPERRVGFVFQHYALFRHMTVAENVAFGLRVRPRRERPSRTEIRDRSWGCSSWCSSTGSRAVCLPSSRADSVSAWPWPGPWPSSPACCSWTSRSAPSTLRCGRSCAGGCGACTTRSA
jgi:hypothetical protein